MVMHSRAFSIALAVLNKFDTACRSRCNIKRSGGSFTQQRYKTAVRLNWRRGGGRRRETRFVFIRIAPQVACRMDVASLALQNRNVRGGILALSCAKRLLAG